MFHIGQKRAKTLQIRRPNKTIPACITLYLEPTDYDSYCKIPFDVNIKRYNQQPSWCIPVLSNVPHWTEACKDLTNPQTKPKRFQHASPCTLIQPTTTVIARFLLMWNIKRYNQQPSWHTSIVQCSTLDRSVQRPYKSSDQTKTIPACITLYLDPTDYDSYCKIPFDVEHQKIR